MGQPDPPIGPETLNPEGAVKDLFPCYHSTSLQVKRLLPQRRDLDTCADCRSLPQVVQGSSGSVGCGHLTGLKSLISNSFSWGEEFIASLNLIYFVLSNNTHNSKLKKISEVLFVVCYTRFIFESLVGVFPASTNVPLKIRKFCNFIFMQSTIVSETLSVLGVFL